MACRCCTACGREGLARSTGVAENGDTGKHGLFKDLDETVHKLAGEKAALRSDVWPRLAYSTDLKSLLFIEGERPATERKCGNRG